MTPQEMTLQEIVSTVAKGNSRSRRTFFDYYL